MWKYNGERLENKNGDWLYLQETWIAPKEDKKDEGEVLRNSLGKTLKVDLDSKGMQLKLFNTNLYFFLFSLIFPL